MALGVDSASNRNEYHEYFLRRKGGRYVGLTNLPPSCADCVAIWEPQPTGTLRASPGLGLYRDCFKLKLLFHDVELSGQDAVCIWCVPSRRRQSSGTLNGKYLVTFLRSAVPNIFGGEE